MLKKVLIAMCVISVCCLGVAYAGGNVEEGPYSVDPAPDVTEPMVHLQEKMIPIIGGQAEKYLVTVLTEFASDKRPGDVMRNFAKGYTKQDHKNIAAFFAAQPWVNTPHAAQTSVDASLVKSCQGCHGKQGEGKGSFPRVAGQPPEYLYHSLMEYKQGTRPSGLMKMVKKIDDAKLQQMADYYSSLK